MVINASIIQGSAIGPASYVVTAADLNPRTTDNELCKFADDAYLIVPACNIDSRVSEIESTDEARRGVQCTNNSIERSHEKLCLEIAEESIRSCALHLAEIERVTALKVLDVTIIPTLCQHPIITFAKSSSHVPRHNTH